MSRLYANNCSTTLSATFAQAATTLTVADGANFPVPTGGDHFNATLVDAAGNIEIIKVEAVAGNTFSSITRAQEGTSDQSWALGDYIELRLTASALSGFAQAATAPVTGNLPEQNANGDLVDSGIAATDVGDLVTNFASIAGVVTADQTELNKLDGYTGNASDLNVLTGAAAAGVTPTEIQTLDGVTSDIQSQIDGKAATGANSDITSLTGLSTPLSVPQGGTNRSTFPSNHVVIGNSTATLSTVISAGLAGQFLESQGALSPPIWVTPNYVLTSDSYLYTSSGANTSSGVYTLTVDTGFGTNTFSWGIIGPVRTDGASSTAFVVTARDGGGYQEAYIYGPGTETRSRVITTPSVPATGRISIRFYDLKAADTRGILFKVWAKKG